eukprot:6793418-Pyramimonas_sp.AAC.1
MVRAQVEVLGHCALLQEVFAAVAQIWVPVDADVVCQGDPNGSHLLSYRPPPAEHRGLPGPASAWRAV